MKIEPAAIVITPGRHGLQAGIQANGRLYMLPDELLEPMQALAERMRQMNARAEAVDEYLATLAADEAWMAGGQVGEGESVA